jgi:hypothetical protein
MKTNARPKTPNGLRPVQNRKERMEAEEVSKPVVLRCVQGKSAY